MVVPDEFALPAWYVLAPLVAVLAGAGAALWRLRARVSDGLVLAFAPWMMVGSTLYVLDGLGGLPARITPFVGAPTVYLTVAAVAAVVWLAAVVSSSLPARPVGLVGLLALAATVVVALSFGAGAGSIEPFWPGVALAATVIVTALAWAALGALSRETIAVTRATGALVVFGHTLDGVTTAVGYDHLGVAETVPASRIILEVGEALPTTAYLGAGWPFALVKVALSAAIVFLFTEYVREEPDQARLVLAFVAAVGLGPGFHNLVLFLVA